MSASLTDARETAAGFSFLPDLPYPGLRPFNKDEWPIFFGRDRMIDDVIERLAARHFVVVHGSSGCGKSSLIRAGVQPRLEREYEGQGWRTCTMRPGSSPMWHLAEAMVQALTPSDAKDVQLIRRCQLALDRGWKELSTSLVGLPGGDRETPVFLLVDQFEELFRYARSGRQDEATLFVNALLRISGERPSWIYAILTVRSDHLGDCALFEGLPEAINQTQYLVPRMSEPELVEAIQEPANLYGGDASERLTAQLITDARGSSDELPLIQHALRYMWLLARGDGGAEAPSLDLPEYERHEVGDIYRALSNHADAVIDDLTRTSANLANVSEKVFRTLIEIDPAGRALRRPLRLSDIVAETGCDVKDVRAVIEAFERRSFLFVERGEDQKQPIVDISHEALIRHWRKMVDDTPDRRTGEAQGWLHREATDGRTWRSLVEASELYDSDPTTVLPERVYEARHSWWSSRAPNESWSQRYGNRYAEVKRLLEASGTARDEADRARREAENQKERTRRITWGLGLSILCLLLAATGWVIALAQYGEADQRATSLTKSEWRRYASVAEGEAREGRADAGVLLGLEALKLTPEGSPPSEVQKSLALSALSGGGSTPTGFSFGSGHLAPVNQVVFSHDGRQLASASDDSTIRIWVAATLEWKQTLEGARGWVHSVDFSPDDQLLAGGSLGEVLIWDLKLGTVKQKFVVGTRMINTVAFSPNGDLLLVGSADGTLQLYHTADGSLSKDLLGPGDEILRAVFNKDGDQILSGSREGVVQVWNVETGKETQIISNIGGAVGGMSFGPNNMIVAAGGDGVKAFDRSGNVIWDEKIELPWAVALRERGEQITIAVASENDRLWLWQLRQAEQGTLIEDTSRELAYGTDYSWSVALSSDGSRLASGFGDGSIRLWNVQSGELIATAAPNKSAPSTSPGQVSADGRWIALHDSSGEVSIVSRETGQEISHLKGQSGGAVLALAFSPDGRQILTGGRSKVVHLWNRESGEQLRGFYGHGDWVKSVAFSRNGQQIASASNDGTVRLWDATTDSPEIVLEGHGGSVNSVTFSPDDERVLSAHEDGTVQLWDRKSGRQLAVFGGHHGTPVHWAAFSDDGNRILSVSDTGELLQWRPGLDNTSFVWPTEPKVQINTMDVGPNGIIALAGDDGRIGLWDSKLNLQTNSFESKVGRLRSIAFSPAGDQIVYGGERSAVGVWTRGSDNPPEILTGHTGGGVQSVGFSPDGRWIVSGGDDGTVRLWDARIGGNPQVLRGHETGVRSVQFNPMDGSEVISAGIDGSVRLWRDGQQRMVLGPWARYGATAFSGDGSRVVAAGDGYIDLFDASKGERIKRFRGPQGFRIQLIAPSSDGTVIASLDEKGTVRVWRGERDEPPSVLELPAAFAYYTSMVPSSDGRRVALGDADGFIRLWTVASQNIEQLSERHNSEVLALGFSPDGTRIVSGGRDGAIYVWDSRTLERALAIDHAHDNHVLSVAFSPDGTQIVSGSYDGTVRLWDANSGKRLSEIGGGDGGILSVAFSHQGKTIALGGSSGIIRLWTPATDQSRLFKEDQPIAAVGFNVDGTGILSSSEGVVKVWDVETGVADDIVPPQPGKATAVAFSPDGKYLAVGSELGTVRLLDYQTGRELTVLPGRHESSVLALAFSPDGAQIASGDTIGSIHIWKGGSDWQNTHASNEFKDNWPIRALEFKPNGEQIIVAGGTSIIRVLNTSSTGRIKLEGRLGNPGAMTAVSLDETGVGVLVALETGAMVVLHPSGEADKTVLSNDQGVVSTACLSNDGEKVVAGTDDGNVLLFDVSSGKSLWPTTPNDAPFHKGTVTAVALDLDAKTVISASADGTVGIWDAQSGKQIHEPRAGHRHAVRAVAVSPDGARIVSGGDDRTVRVWDRVSEDTLAEFDDHGGPVRAVAISADGTQVLSGSDDGIIRLWDVKDKRMLWSLRVSQGSVNSVSFGPKGETIMASSSDGTSLWSVEGGDLKYLAAFQHGSDSLRRSTMSADGHYIATSDDRGILRMYKTPPYRTWDDLVKHARASVGRALTEEERRRLYVLQEPSSNASWFELLGLGWSRLIGGE